MKHIKLFEHWQWLNREEEGSTERDYQTTVDSLLTWAAGPDWREDWSWMEESLLVDDKWLEEDEAIGYHELLKKNGDSEIEVYSQETDGQVESSWSIGGVGFNLISWDWPFSDGDGDLTEVEMEVVDRLVRELAGDPVMRSANVVDIIDFVQLAIREKGEEPAVVSSIGFKNWYRIQRSNAN